MSEGLVSSLLFLLCTFLFLIEIRLKFNKQLSLWAYVPVQTLSKLPEGLLSPHAAPVLAGTARRTFVFCLPGHPSPFLHVLIVCESSKC